MMILKYFTLPYLDNKIPGLRSLIAGPRTPDPLTVLTRTPEKGAKEMRRPMAKTGLRCRVGESPRLGCRCKLQKEKKSKKKNKTREKENEASCQSSQV